MVACIQKPKKECRSINSKNKRIQASIHKRRDNSVWKDNNRRIVLEELVSLLDLLDDVVDILDGEDFDCGEVPDEINDDFTN